MMPERKAATSAMTVREVMRRYYTVQLAYSLAGGFLFGVYPIFLHSRGLDQFQINSVLATYFVVLFLTDVPTGAFADALGRRTSFVLGTGIRVAAFLTYFFAHSYWVFLVAESIDGIGTTFANGAVDAWGVDALDRAGHAGVKDKIFSRITQLMNSGFMVSAIVGAYVANVDIAWPWLCGAVGYLVAAFIGMAMMTGESERETEIDLAVLPGQIITRVGEGLGEGFSSRTVMWLSMAGAVTLGAWAPYWLEWPILFERSYGVGVWIIGWIYCLLTLARIAGAEMVSRMRPDETSRAGRLVALVAVASVCLAVAGVLSNRPNPALAVLFVMNLCTGAIQPLAQSWFNEQVSAGRRATMLSFSSTLGTMGGSMGLLFGGYVADTAGLAVAWQVAGALSMVAAPCYWMLRREGPRAAAATGAGR